MIRRNRIVLIVLVLVLQTLPVIIAAFHWAPGWVFSGFLSNPIDGNSYLAKMQEGWSGGWQFTLLYSPEAVHGSYLFLFYIFLGHLAKWLGASLILTYHAARILGSAALLWALSRFCDLVYGDDKPSADLAFGLASLGSGLGWLYLLLTGTQTGDFWVAEAYPFLSMLMNPHFPLGLAVLLGMVQADFTPPSRWKGPLLLAAGLTLSIVLPFALVILALLLGAHFAWNWLAERRFQPGNVLWSLTLGGIFLLYQFWIIQSNPSLAIWNKQNITSALPFLDFVTSLSPALLMAFVGIFAAWKQKRAVAFVLVAWLVGGCVLIYFPFNLQRRFMAGIFIPVSLLAVMSMSVWKTAFPKIGRWLRVVLLSLSLPTNLVVILAILVGGIGITAKSPNPLIYLPAAKAAGLNWIKTNTSSDSVILASASNGLFIPAWTGRRVVYGHPFETIHADQRKKEVDAFFAGEMQEEKVAQFLRVENIGYILTDSPVEKNFLTGYAISAQEVFAQGDVAVFRLNP